MFMEQNACLTLFLDSGIKISVIMLDGFTRRFLCLALV